MGLEAFIMRISLKKLTACVLAVLLFALLLQAPLWAGVYEDSCFLNRQGVNKIKGGNLRGGISDLERALQINPFNDTALCNLACARNNYGVWLAERKDYNEALRQFYAAKAQKPEDVLIRLNLLSLLLALKKSDEVEKEAQDIIKLRPLDSEICIKAAVALEKSENISAAVDILNDFAAKQPDNEKIHSALGEILYKVGANAESEYHLRRSLELEPQNDSAKKMLNRLELENKLEEKTLVYESVHFELKYPDEFLVDTAENVLKIFEEAYDDIGAKLNFYPRGRTRVVVLKSDDFKSMRDLPSWAGGVYDGRIRLYMPSGSGSESSLKSAARHEYTHHVIHLLCAGKCPIWLNEGLAQIFEYDHLPQINMPKDLAAKMPPLEQLERGFKSQLNREEAKKLYLFALYAAERIVLEYGWAKTAEILLSIGQGRKTAFDKLLSKAKR